jgi:hypothetical protein
MRVVGIEEHVNRRNVGVTSAERLLRSPVSSRCTWPRGCEEILRTQLSRQARGTAPAWESRPRWPGFPVLLGPGDRYLAQATTSS